MQLDEKFRKKIETDALIRPNDKITIIDNEFTGAHGIWLFDFRAVALQPDWLNEYAEIFWQQYADKLPFQVGGMETAGIPLVAAIVMKSAERGTPVNGFFIRKSRKRMGLMKAVEGTLTDDPIILVDDLINSGQTLHKQLKILRAEGALVSHVFTILAFRDSTAYAFLQEQNVIVNSLFSLKDFNLPLLVDKDSDTVSDSFRELWKYSAPKPSHHLVVEKSAPLFHQGIVYFGCDDGIFRALDASSGRITWEFKTGKHPKGKGILSNPAISDNSVFFGAYDGNVYALDIRTGKKQWEYSNADWVGSSPALAKDLDLLFIGLEFGLMKRRGGIAALDLASGTERWSAYSSALTHGSPLYISEKRLVVIGSNDGILYAYDAHTGALRWQFRTSGDIKSAPAYDERHDYIVVNSMDGNMYVLKTDGTCIYAKETGAGIYSSALIADSVAYSASLDKTVYAIDLSTLKLKWEFETNGRIFATPAVAEDSLWIGSNDGKLYELALETGRMLHFFQTTEKITNAIAYDEVKKHFFVPTHANELYCLERNER